MNNNQLNSNPKNEEEEDAEFLKKHSSIFFRTTNNNYGSKSSKIQLEQGNGIDGRFTNHLLKATMYRNHSLNTTCDKEKYIEGSKDWMEHLN